MLDQVHRLQAAAHLLAQVQVLERRRHIVTAIQFAGTAILLICQIISGSLQLMPEWAQWTVWLSLIVIWGFGWAGVAIWLVTKRDKLNKEAADLLRSTPT